MLERWLIHDGHGNGLVEREDGSRAFVDREHPEERWIRTMTEQADFDWDAHERELAIEAEREAERDRWAREDNEWPWRRRERPAGLMYGVAAGDQDQEC
jgi:hypothetical protein